jgi:hypothetical protein
LPPKDDLCSLLDSRVGTAADGSLSSGIAQH